jgi:xanthine dehydrogenase accessory factor
VRKESELWRFVIDRLDRGEDVMLLIVAESAGSSPGRAGYKMAVAADGELIGSIGGGVMEVELVERAKRTKGKSKNVKGKADVEIIEQVHRKNVPNSSGMICSGKQTIIVKPLTSHDLGTISGVIDSLTRREPKTFEISDRKFDIVENETSDAQIDFTRTAENEFMYRERLGHKHELFIVGGGHCALALSELMSKMDFRISIFDDRPSLNTLDKNKYASEITRVDAYDDIARHIPNGEDVYVVVMTLGYASDAVVIRKLFDHDVKYLGVLGSKAKMATLMKELKDEGFDPDKLSRIHTPIGLPINSRTPEEIAVSIAAEIISVKNS